jgi:hypothetical protein
LENIGVFRDSINNGPLSNGGQRWIRTIEGVSQQIYSLPRLATSVSAQQKTKTSKLLVEGYSLQDFKQKYFSTLHISKSVHLGIDSFFMKYQFF